MSRVARLKAGRFEVGCVITIKARDPEDAALAQVLKAAIAKELEEPRNLAALERACARAFAVVIARGPRA